MKKKIIEVSLLFLVIILMIFGINRMIKYEITAIQGSATQARASTSSGGTLVAGEQNPSSYQYHINTGIWDGEVGGYYDTTFFVPKYKDFQLYCIQPGTALKFSGCMTYRKAKALLGGSKKKTDTRTNWNKTQFKEALQHYFNDNPNDDYIYNHTLPEFTPIGTYSLPVAAAYIISDKPIGEWSQEKQKAIWNLRKTGLDNGLVIGDANADNSGSSIYDAEAKNYATYDSSVRDKGLQPGDKTNLESLSANVNQSTKEYTVGPFNMTYTNGIYGNIAFAGVSNMTVIGYNSNNEVVNSNIKIKKIILKDKATGIYSSSVTPEYFTPSTSLKVDETKQVYPASGQDFKIIFDDPNTSLDANSSNRVVTISIKVTFKYMLANGKYAKIQVRQGMLDYAYSAKAGTVTITLTDNPQQYVMAADAIRSVYEQEFEIGKGANILGMNLGGYVWEDGVATKESKADGVNNTSGDGIDKPLKNIKVTLYTSDGKVATLLSNPNEEGLSSEEIMHRINPTYTDEEGFYLFEGLDLTKKYYVKFEYNGQIYLPTEYLNTEDKQYSSVSEMVKAGLYNTDAWYSTSKGTENVDDRNNFDKKFAEIGSYPENYQSSNSLGKIGNKNVTFTQKDLMGYTLNSEGKYQQTNTQLIDGYLYDENGNETATYQDGVISQKVRQYIQNNKKFPDADAMKSIYDSIAGSNTEIWRKLQFIEDCQIASYTQPQGGEYDLYPVYDQFTISQIYPGQLYVNQGLWRRQEYDSAIRKDVYKAVMKINNKTVVYNYDKRSDDDKYWDINVRMSDYDAYYGTGYNREVYKTDYEYSSETLNHPGADLEMYITYKITIRNQSQSIMTQIREVVDYYDKDYTYRDDLSWVTYIDGSKKNTVSDDEYYNAMVAEDTSKIANARDTKSTNTSRYGSSTHSDITNSYNDVYIQGLENKKLATGESAYIYLTFQVNKQNGKVILDDESSPKMNYAEVNGYTTYYKDNTLLPNGVTKNSSNVAGLLDRDSNPGNLLQSDIDDNDRYEKNFEDDTDRAKALRVVIDEEAVRKANGTVWEDERTISSGDSIIGDGIRQDDETKIAGVTVQLVEKTIDGKEYIWQETTTDAKGYYSFESYIPGDYVIRFYYGNTASTTKINGNDDYSAGGQNDTSYNGQDFKSTTYQQGITQSSYTDESNHYTGYKNTTTQNETGTYGYDIYAADSNQSNVSDAKDLWTTSNIPTVTYKPNATISEQKAIHGRTDVINYSNQNVTNHKAEVLASPYETPTYNGTKYTASEMDALIDELINNTYMTAETGVIVAEFEYDRQQGEGIKGIENNGNNSSNDYVSESNRYNGGYTLANIDLGLTERPKAQLEIDKSISNLKVTLANNSVLFDVNKAGDNVIWKDHIEYNLASKKDSQGKYEEYYGKNGKNRYSYRDEVDELVAKADKGLIQLTMDEELMHGATIEITYKVKVTNVGEVDYEGQKYYYLGDSSGANIVTTVANQVIDYVANNLQFNAQNASNQKWEVINNSTLITTTTADKDENIVNRRLDNNVKQYNNVIQTEGLNNVLKPGESAEQTLVLTQLISTENTSDDLTYSNMVEIAKTSNTVGRRMAYSVVGNQDPTLSAAAEVDSSVAEKVVILPPFGDTHIFYILGAVIAVILIGGIVFIIKKVLKK